MPTFFIKMGWVRGLAGHMLAPAFDFSFTASRSSRERLYVFLGNIPE